MAQTRPALVTVNVVLGRKPGFQNAVTAQALQGQREQGGAPAEELRVVLVMRDE